MSKIVDFYLGKVVNNTTITNIQCWDYDRLEKTHDYIQWLFPLDEPSRCSPDAPVLTPEDIRIFNLNMNFKYSLYKSFLLMLDFYGYVFWITDGEPFIYPRNLSNRLKNWATPNNHNYLRITRILKSMTLLGCPEYAKMFLEVLKELWETCRPDSFGNQKYEEGCTLWYWQQACGEI